ncbi:MAG: hypothetical protein WD648_15945 [Planctomycetaceae bacterium]
MADERKPSRWWMAVAALLLLLALYPLSVGPFVWLIHYGYLNDSRHRRLIDAGASFYRPLDRFVAHHPAVQLAYASYLHWWTSLGAPP